MEFRKLKVYNSAIDFTADIYEISKTIPEHEKYGLISQLRRAGVSIVLNIAEGSGSGSDAEFSRFLRMAIRSLYEVDAILELLVKLNYVKKDDLTGIYKKRLVLGKMLGQFIKTLRA